MVVERLSSTSRDQMYQTEDGYIFLRSIRVDEAV
jgi:hypothetical protein